MKLWTLLPIFVEVVLAISANEEYKHYRDRLAGKKHPHHRRPHNRLSSGDHKSIHHDHSGCLDTPAFTKTHHPPAYPPGTSTSTHTTTHTPPANPVNTHTSTPTTTHTSSTKPPSTTTSGGGGGGGSTPSSDIQAYLNAHNTLRAKHGAAPLTWSDTLASAAQKWANHCVWEHSGGSVGPYGENLAAGTGDFPIASAIQLWADEESAYVPSNPMYSHYTQMVWKATKQLGCAVATCPKLISNDPAKFYVCEYDPPGNVEGEFGQNVQ